MDVANLRRRTRCGLIRNLVSSLQDGDPSDGEEEEQTDLFQQILALTASLGDRAKMRMAEMIAGSGLGQMRALSGKFRSGLGLGGVTLFTCNFAAGMMPSSQYPMHPRHRFLGAAQPQYPPAPVEPPRPVIQVRCCSY